MPRAIRSCRDLLAEADLGGEANVLPFLAGLEAMRGRFAVSRRLLDRAEGLYAELGQGTFGLAVCDGSIGLGAACGRQRGRREALHRAQAAFEAMGDHASLATCAVRLAEVTHRDGRDEEAEKWALLADRLGSSDDIPTQFLLRAVRAKLLAENGEVASAEAYAREAVESPSD